MTGIPGAIGLLHPGEMGAAIGAGLRSAGRDVLWASHGRSGATIDRAQAAGLHDVGTIEELARQSVVLLSVCPPYAAEEVARSVARFGGTYVDANAIAPETSRRVGEVIGQAGGRYVDGGIIGPPPVTAGTTRLYVSGPAAREVAPWFEGTTLAVEVVEGDVGAASALKMAYAGWTKGSMALLLAARAAARAAGVEAGLLAEWALSQPELTARSEVAARSAATKGWRWIAEMDEIAATLAAAGVPDGALAAAAEIYRRSQHAGSTDLDAVLDVLLRRRPEPLVESLGPGNLAAAEALLDAELGGRRQARLGELHDVLALPGFVASLADRLVGIATIDVRGAGAELAALAVASDCQGAGVGGALVEQVAAAAAAEGATELWLVTTNDNLDALLLYQRHGFRLSELRVGAVDEARRLKPTIPTTGDHGMPLRDELVLVRPLSA